MKVYKKGEYITNETGTVTKDSEIYICSLADAEAAFFTHISAKGGFMTNNDEPLDGFKKITKQEVDAALSPEIDRAMTAEDVMKDILTSAKATSEEEQGYYSIGQDIYTILEVYKINMKYLDTDEMFFGKVDTRSRSDRAISKTKIALEELFQISIASKPQSGQLS